MMLEILFLIPFLVILNIIFALCITVAHGEDDLRELATMIQIDLSWLVTAL